jgi:hypothetical protein
LTSYKFTVLDEQSRVIETTNHNFPGDVEAFEAAQKMSDGRVIEVWRGSTRIFRLQPQRFPGPSDSQSD